MSSDGKDLQAGEATPAAAADGFKAPAPKPKPMSVNITGDSWSQKGHGLMLPPKPKVALSAPSFSPSAAPPAPSEPTSSADASPATFSAPPGPNSGEPSVDLKYSEPIWSPKTVLHPWSFEVLRNGASLGVQPLNHRGFLLVGRLPICDIELEHGSVSRQHAVIQHRSTGQIYVYDLNSTHGTFVNKRKVKPMVYVPIKNGDVVKFGETARMFVLQGGPEEEETPPAAQQQTQPPRGEAKVAEKSNDADGSGAAAKAGGGESDVFTGNMSDFKAFMKEQQGKAAAAKGKKGAKGGINKDMLPEIAKQARAAFRGKATEDPANKDKHKAAEEDSESSSEDADPLGLGIGGEGKKKRKKKEKKGKKGQKDGEEEPEDLEITKHGTVADEFYSSGEENDDFYDRTKAKRRGDAAAEQRPQTVRALTPADIRAQLKDLEKKREDALFALHEAKASGGAKSRKDEDELDAYMNNVKGTIEAQKERQLAEKLAELNAEYARLTSLLSLTESALDRAQPLPPPPSSSSSASSATSSNSTPLSAPKSSFIPSKNPSSVFSSPSPAPTSFVSTPSTEPERRLRTMSGASLAAYVGQFEKETKKIEQDTDSAAPELTPDIEARLGTVRKRTAPATSSSSTEKEPTKKRLYVEKEEEVVTWVPPEDQKGDGRTKLNEKFGY